MNTRTLAFTCCLATAAISGCSDSSITTELNYISTSPVIFTDDILKDENDEFIDNRLESFAVNGIGLDENDQPVATRLTGASLLAGLIPAEAVSTEVSNAIDAMNTSLKEYAGYEGDESAITSTRNELDILENLIASHDVEEFEKAKQAMRVGVESNEVRGYNNRIVILESKDEADTDKFYYIVDYNYAPSTGLLTKTIGASIQVLDQSTQSNLNLFTAIRVANLNTDTFSEEHYNQPLSEESFFGNDTFGVQVSANYESNKDYGEITSQTAFSLNQDEATYKRMRIEVDYDTREVNIYLSDFVNAFYDTSGNIIKDPNTEAQEALVNEYDDFCKTHEEDEKCIDPVNRYYFDDEYRRVEAGNTGTPTPKFTYTGSAVAWR